MSLFVLAALWVASALFHEASAVVIAPAVPARRRVVDALALAELPHIPSVTLLALPLIENPDLAYDEVYRKMSMRDAMSNFTQLASKSLIDEVGMIQKGSVIHKGSVISESRSSLRGVSRHSHGAGHGVTRNQTQSADTSRAAFNSTVEKINELIKKTLEDDETRKLACDDEEIEGKRWCEEAKDAITDAQSAATSLMGKIQGATLSAKIAKQGLVNAKKQKLSENATFTDKKADLDQELLTLPGDLRVCSRVLEELSDCEAEDTGVSFAQVFGKNLQCKQCGDGQQVAEIGGKWKSELSKVASIGGREALRSLLGGSEQVVLLNVRQVAQRRLSVHAKTQPEGNATKGAECPMENEKLDSGDKGKSYKGCQNRTVSGLPCLPWSLAADPGMAGLGAHSYCRNPSATGGEDEKYTIWCLVDSSLNGLGWESCLPVQPPHGFETPEFDCDEAAGACALTAESCQTLLGRFDYTCGEMETAHKQATANLSTLVREHIKEVASFDSVISANANQIAESNVLIAEYTATMHTELDEMKKHSALYEDSRNKFIENQEACCAGRKERQSQRCALEKVRASVAMEGNMSVYDCDMGEWEDDGVCFVVDDNGVAITKTCLADASEEKLEVKRKQKRAIESGPLNGVQCETTTQEIKCELELCPIDCKMSPWDGWSECPVVCGTGVQTRTRRILVEKQGSGSDCDLDEDSRECAGEPCDVDCELDYEWPEMDHTVCSKPCMVKDDPPGHYENIRGIRAPRKNGGRECADERLACSGSNSHTCRLKVEECNAHKVCDLSDSGLVHCNSPVDVILLVYSPSSESVWEEETIAVEQMIKSMGDDVGVNVMIWSGPREGQKASTGLYSAMPWTKACIGATWVAANPKHCGAQWLRKNVTTKKDELVADFKKARNNRDSDNLDPGWMSRRVSAYPDRAYGSVIHELRTGMGRPGVQKVVVMFIGDSQLGGWATYRTKEYAEQIIALGARLMTVAFSVASTNLYVQETVSHPRADNRIIISHGTSPLFEPLFEPSVINKALVRMCPGIAAHEQGAPTTSAEPLVADGASLTS